MNRTPGLLIAFGVAMALLESAVVVYMRRLYYPDNPLELFPLQFLVTFDPVLELSCEAATVIMLVTVALLAERASLTRRFKTPASAAGAQTKRRKLLRCQAPPRPNRNASC